MLTTEIVIPNCEFGTSFNEYMYHIAHASNSQGSLGPPDNTPTHLQAVEHQR